MRGLELIPEHMHSAVGEWVRNAEPHPAVMGAFLHAVLCNDLVHAFAYADDRNRRAMQAWAELLYQHVPSTCWGSKEKLVAWWERHHPEHAGETVP